MAFTHFVPQFRSQESQDALSFKIWDESHWSSEEASCTTASLVVTYYDDANVATVFTAYPLITGGDRTKFNEYLSTDGHQVLLSAILPVALTWTKFTDGYFDLKITYNDGTYIVGSEPYYIDSEGFLAHANCKSRKLPALISWPDIDYDVNRDIFLLRMYLEAAEDAADLALKTKFLRLITLINSIFDNYEIVDCW